VIINIGKKIKCQKWIASSYYPSGVDKSKWIKEYCFRFITEKMLSAKIK
jgi:hypothetical protein